MIEELVAAFPHVPAYRFDLSETYAMRDRGPDARQRLADAAGMLEDLIRERPNIPDYRFSLAHLYMRLSHVHGRERQRDDSLAALRRAMTVQAELADRHADVFAYALAAAFYESALARMFHEMKQPDEAIVLLESAVGRLESLPEDLQGRHNARRLLSRCHEGLTAAYTTLGHQESAGEAHRKSEALRPPPR